VGRHHRQPARGPRARRLRVRGRGRSQTWQGRPIKGQTIYRETAAIWRVLKIAKRRGHRHDLPDEWPKVRRDPKDQRKSGKHWPPELVREYLMALHQEARDEAIVAALTQLRAAELKRLRFDAIRRAPPGADTNWIIELQDSATKMRDARIVGLCETAHAIIERRRQEDPHAELVFVSANFKKARRETSKRLGFSCTLTLRDLRHTFLTEGLRLTADATAVMRVAGHKDLRTTEKYMSSTIARATSVAAAAERALDPGHLTRDTEAEADALDGEGASEVAAMEWVLMERAMGLEPTTLSLGTRCANASASDYGRLGSVVVPLRPGKRGPILDDPLHLPVTPAEPASRRKGRT
jgi:site-specific recombinase XerD